jgi:hypothetical protein
MTDRAARIADDLRILRALADSSSIFSFESIGEPSERFILRYSGKGIRRNPSGQSQIEFQDVHELEMRMPFSYPDVPPDVRWLTPIYHPNVSYSGFLSLSDIGLDWEPGMGVDLLCERLWDVIRLERHDVERATNPSARRWISEQKELALPLDHRPLRDRAALANRNIVRYQRRGEPEFVNSPSPREVLYIDDDTPTPSLPPLGHGGNIRPRPHSDDVLYIE